MSSQKGTAPENLEKAFNATVEMLGEMHSHKPGSPRHKQAKAGIVAKVTNVPGFSDRVRGPGGNSEIAHIVNVALFAHRS